MIDVKPGDSSQNFCQLLPWKQLIDSVTGQMMQTIQLLILSFAVFHYSLSHLEQFFIIEKDYINEWAMITF